MKKLLSKVAALSVGLGLAIGVGVSLGVENAPTKQADATSSSWELVTSAPADWSGEYILANGTSGNIKIFNTSNYAGGDSSTDIENVSVSSSKITVEDSKSITIVPSVAGTSEKYSVIINGYYVGRNANSNGISAIKTSSTYSSSYDNTITYEGGKVKIAGNGGRVLTIYQSSTVKYYAASNNSTQLYKKAAVTQTYTVSFDANGGSGSMSQVSDIPAGSYTMPQNGFTAPENKAFVGWKVKVGDVIGDTVYAAGNSDYIIGSNITLVAQWVNAHSVTYTAGEHGTGSFEHSSQPEGSYTLLPFASLSGVSASEGYKFKDYTVGGVAKNPGDAITLNASAAVTVNFEIKPEETTYVFATNFATYASSWTTTYGQHVLNGKTDVGGEYAATIDLVRSNKQTDGVGSEEPFLASPKSTTTSPVLVFTLNETGYKIKDVLVTFSQRGSNTPTFNLYKGNSCAGEALDSAEIGTSNMLEATNLNDVSFSLDCVATSSSNNVGAALTSIYISIEPASAFGTLDHITITSTPNAIYHVGETYSPAGLVVTAYDGENESTANFKDVTALVETDLDNPTPFEESDVPGFDCEISYTGDGGSDTTSFHVYVYALAEYELVTSAPADWSGQYLIVGSKTAELVTTYYAMNGSLSPLDVDGNHKIVSPDANNVIESGQELEFTIAAISGGYSIQAKSGKYIGWASGSSNGLTESESALVNTLSFSSGSVNIAGSGGRKLLFNTAGSGRFRYSQDGNSLKLYKLKSSSRADEYAQTFLGAFTCDASGNSEPSFKIKEGETYWSWSLLASEYDTLTSVEKEEFRLGVASESGDNIAQALARYDYIVGKYGKAKYADFMSRNPASINEGRPFSDLFFSENSAISVIVVMSVASATLAFTLIFVFRRKKQR